jgi:PRTRC genetic system ThiF family protein
LDWEAIPTHLTENLPLTSVDIVIGCVDTRAARLVIQCCATRSSTVGDWLDIGNNANSGQFILGEPLNFEDQRTGNRLPTVADLYPEVVNTELEEDSLPSCSAAEALERQEPFVNTTLANHSLSLLAHLFRYGTIEHHGGFVNLATGHTIPLRVEPATWRRIQKHRDGKGTARG